MKSSKNVLEYIEHHNVWSWQLKELRALFNKTELTETIKWGAPSYDLEGSLVAGIGAFKNHCAIWFHQGVFLKDKNKVLLNAQKEVTKAMRQWRFEQNDTINKESVLAYINEAIENCKQGKKLKPSKNKQSIIPEFLSAYMSKNDSFNSAFKSLTAGKQREYANYIAEAKREATKQTRLTKIVPMVLEGKGLHDKYRNC